MIDPFDNPALQTGEADYHVISTDHPYLKSLGLSVFTTGNLYKWYNTKDETGAYSNRKLINNASVDTLLGTPLHNTDGWGEWYGWRKRDYTGNYKVQKWNNWSWTYPLLISKYTQSDIGWTTWASAAPLGYTYDFAYDTTTSAQASQTPPVVAYETKISEFPGPTGDQAALKAMSPIISIIQMNRWMNTFKRLFEEKDWKNSTGAGGGLLSGASFTGRNLHAMDIFLKDIKASKAGHVAFSGLVEFDINLADGGVQCLKEDYVSYKLFLYDDFKPRLSTNFAVLKDPVIRGAKTDATGRVYASSVDGEYSDVDPNNAKHLVVGPMERSWNPITEKWESGTANMMGIVDTPGSKIDVAYNNPVVENLVHSDIGLDLDGDPKNHFAPSSGYVIPLHQQNKNPMQWQPNYAQASGCREGEEANRKAKVIGFNFNPNKEYPHGSLVMLSKIGSIWHMTDMGSGVTADKKEEITAGFDGQWEFQYLATNSLSFFNAKEPYIDSAGNPGERKVIGVEPDRVERAFHSMYYADDVDNGMTYHPTVWSPPTASYTVEGVSYNDQFSTIGVNPIYSQDGWWQFSSFDFMDKTMCGTRSKNALGTTQAGVDAADRAIPYGPLWRNPAHSGPFFGCVFPDGYRATDTLKEYWMSSGPEPIGDNRPFFIAKAWGGLQTSSPSDGQESALVNSMTVQGLNKVNPFYDRGTWFFAGGQWGYTTKRGDNCAATNDRDHRLGFGQGYEGSTGEDAYAAVSFQGPSMFFQESEYSNQDLLQLPADIGTNASPKGENGCPFQDIHAFDAFHKPTNSGVAIMLSPEPMLAEKVALAFCSQSWLRKSDALPPQDTAYTIQDSAFDFKPKRANTIQFRPLKFDMYTQFCRGIGVDFADYRRGTTSHPVLPFWTYPANATRARWSAAGVDNMVSKTTPASPMSVTRNKLCATNGGAVDFWTIFSDPNDPSAGGSGLLFNSDIKDEYYRVTQKDAFEEGYFPSYQGRTHKTHYWNPDYMDDNDRWMAGKNYSGPNAFGVIGACCTIRANLSITFATTQQIGMNSETWSHAGSNKLYDFINIKSPARWWQRPAWGGSNRDYNTNRTTELHATIYHAWPRSQTLFDSRHYAVHHFNERPIWRGLERAPSVSGVEFEDLTGNKVLYGVDTRFPYRIDKLGVDIRVPSTFGPVPTPPSTGNVITLATGVSVWADDTELGGTVGGKVMPEEYWNIDYNRIGKLLPYKYRFNTIGIPWASGYNTSMSAGSVILNTAIPNNTPVRNLLDKLVLISPGSGYQVGDVVGNKRFGIEASVMGVVDNPSAADDGAITQLEVFNIGRDIPTSQCFGTGILMDKDTRGGIKMENVATNGLGFEGFFVNSKVGLAMAVDQKPLYVDTSDGRIFRISALANDTSAQKGEGQPPPDFGFVTTPTSKSIIIDEEFKSTDGKYDVFLHFHNDIAHTWGNNHPDYTNARNPYENDEQWIETAITSL